ncbi:MAG: sugar ABC transporter ATP-binding protein, partial [Caldilineaceae bacterium]
MTATIEPVAEPNVARSSAPVAPAAAHGAPILEVRNISKRFPGVIALDDVSLAFYPGEVHASVGENGAGKSTLMKILAGAYVPDKGEILFQGAPVSFSHPSQAQEAGISIIYQEFNLLPERTVAQNVFLGREPSRLGVLNNRMLRQMTQQALHDLDAALAISPDADVKTLSVAEQQMVEIAKALSFDSRVLIMDEPTAALSMTEVALLNQLVRKLVERGMAVLFISHRFKEVFGIASKITVLKDGKLVDTVNAGDVTPGQVIKMMVGRDLDHYFPPRAAAGEIGDVALRMRNVSTAKLRNVSLELKKGEILGVAGLQGS